MDGLLVKINFDFLKELESRKLITSGIRIKFLMRDSSRQGNLYKSYANFAAFQNDPDVKLILADSKYLCSAGFFPVVENIVLTNNNLTFSNRYAWYNITGSRYNVKTVTYDSARAAIYDAQLKNYVTLSNTLFDTYTKNVNSAIAIRLNSYMDPCYVDAGYVSPNHEPTP